MSVLSREEIEAIGRSGDLLTYNERWALADTALNLLNRIAKIEEHVRFCAKCETSCRDLLGILDETTEKQQAEQK